MTVDKKKDSTSPRIEKDPPPAYPTSSCYHQLSDIQPKSTCTSPTAYFNNTLSCSHRSRSLPSDASTTNHHHPSTADEIKRFLLLGMVKKRGVLL